jgi:expansin (peptidoglycan-binding protein)
MILLTIHSTQVRLNIDTSKQATDKFTAVMGLKKDLNFKGNEFSHVASAYAIAHLVMQGPNGKTNVYV